MKLGTTISKVATPIAGMLRADCFDPVTRDLRPDSPCGKTRARLDMARNVGDVVSAIYDRFWSNKGDIMENEEMDYVFTVIVRSTDLRLAIDKINEGKIIAHTVRPVPKKPPTQQ